MPLLISQVNKIFGLNQIYVVILAIQLTLDRHFLTKIITSNCFIFLMFKFYVKSRSEKEGESETEKYENRDF